MVKTYYKNLRRMFKSNILRLGAISLIIAIGISVVTGVCAVSEQIRDALATASLTPQEMYIANELADKIELIGNILPPFFIVISALTALTTVTRLVDEERPTFACYKTLGYSDFSIVLRQIVFALVCAVVGCAIGLLSGSLLLRPIIFNVVKIKFNVPDASGAYLTQGLIWSVVMSVAIILIAAVISILRCREKPAGLLRPKPPKAGNKILLEYVPFFWKRLKFKFKSATRNIFRFKGKMIITILSVAGATTMLFVGLGLISSINSEQNTDIQGIDGFADSMNAIAAIITLCGVALAVLVLFNLTNINIEERKRELATLKVLGYTQIEVAGFIYRELMVLSVIGIIIGLPSGYFLDGFLFDYLDFGSIELIEWYVWVAATAIALLSVLLADVLLFRKINKIEMATSLKVIE